MIQTRKNAKARVIDASMHLRIWQLAALACTTIAVLGLLMALSVERNREANDWVEHTETVLNALADYTREFVDAEAAQRGYLLTRQDAYLAPYEAVRAGNKAKLKQLKALVAGESERRELQRLSQIFGDKLDEIALTVRLMQAGNPAGALAVVREGQRQRYTVEFRRLSGEIADSEAALLDWRQVSAENENRNILFSIAIGGIMAVMLIVVVAQKTIARIEDRAFQLIRGITAVADGHLDRRVASASPDGIGKMATAFNEMADRLLAAKQAREAVEVDLAQSNRELVAEIEERTAVQSDLSLSVTELRRSNEELDNFAYGASHDLKAPLRGIRNLTEWIADDVKGSAAADTIENLALLRNRVDRLDLLLESLLQYSRVGRVGGVAEDVDIAQLIGEIAEYSAPRAGFSVTCRGEFPIIRTHKAPLEQVLRNLISNALKHHDGGTGAVVVSARDLGATIEIRIEDDGPGIPAAFHQKIFQMFQTLKSRDEVEGSGMGLAIVKKSVEGHGGTIRVESAPPQRGTAFVFTWKKDRLALAA
jgi:signal transduction histidine kinase